MTREDAESVVAYLQRLFPTSERYAFTEEQYGLLVDAVRNYPVDLARAAAQSYRLNSKKTTANVGEYLDTVRTMARNARQQAQKQESQRQEPRAWAWVVGRSITETKANIIGMDDHELSGFIESLDPYFQGWQDVKKARAATEEPDRSVALDAMRKGNMPHQFALMNG